MAAIHFDPELAKRDVPGLFKHPDMEFARRAVEQNPKAVTCFDSGTLTQAFKCDMLKGNGLALEHLPDCQKDQTAALDAIGNHADALRWVAPFLRENPTFLMEAFRKNNAILSYYDNPTIPAHRAFVCKALQENGDALQHVPAFKKDREAVRIAVTSRGRALQYATTFQDDWDIVEAALKQDGYAIEDAPLFKTNKKALLIAVKTYDRALREYQWYDNRCDDEELIRTAVTYFGSAFQYASNRLRGFEDIALLAIEKEPSAYKYIAPQLKDRYEFVKEALARQPLIFRDLPGEYKTEPELIAIALKKVTYLSNVLNHTTLPTDPHALCTIIAACPKILDYLYEQRQSSIIEKAFEYNGLLLCHLSEKYKSLNLCKIAVKSNSRAATFIPTKWKGHSDFSGEQPVPPGA